MEEKVSRKEFLSMLGYGAFFVVGAMIGLGAFSERSATDKKDANLFPKASASSLGLWTLGPNTLSIAIHAALLNNGKVLYVSGSGNNPKNAKGPFKAGLLDPKTQSQTEIILAEDLFCGGHCQLGNGNILFGGGTKAYKTDTFEKKFQGLSCAYIFDVASESFVKVSSMAHGRWYPTLVCLSEGEIFTVNGSDEFGCMNDLTEIYDLQNDSWTIKFDPNSDLTYCVGMCSSEPGAGSPCYGGPNHGTNPPVFMYPRMHLLPNGLVAVCGQKKDLRSWNPSTFAWRTNGNMITGPRSYGTSILLPLQNKKAEIGQILVVGGSSDSDTPATNKCEIVSPTPTGRLVTRSTNPMNYARKYPSPVILPDGKVLIIGGTTQGNNVENAVYSPELYDPSTQQWTVLPPATVPRMYHSVALLLQDGRIWTASTSYSTTNAELRTEIFSPSYMFEDRPAITGSPVVDLAKQVITIPTDNPSTIASVSLVRTSTITHNLNTDQRLLWLQIVNSGASKIVAKAPISKNLAPPGYYLIHVINNNGIPSEGAFIKIS